MVVAHDPVIDRDRSQVDDAVASLSDDELELELTVAAHDPVRRTGRYERLLHEWLTRQRGYRRAQSPTGRR